MNGINVALLKTSVNLFIPLFYKFFKNSIISFVAFILWLISFFSCSVISPYVLFIELIWKQVSYPNPLFPLGFTISPSVLPVNSLGCHWVTVIP